MIDILQATSDVLEESGKKSLDASLHLPMAEMIADYTPETHEILAQLDAEYVTHISDGKPWRDESGVHIAVDHEVLVRVLRALSQTPEAYAEVRAAEGHYAAENLASISPTADGAALSARPAGNARALGVLDAIAEDVTSALHEDEAVEWDKRMVQLLRSTSPAGVPSYASDAAGYIDTMWTRTLMPTTRNGDKTFREQSSRILDPWGKGRGDGFKPPSGLKEDCVNGQFAAYEETKRALGDL
ncbi:hypothetical protein AB0K47_03440 [Streptomyces tirandamycinicus]|uniref:hypothetical protein n=1 Tax=Streptomyces tirandamycinicus TaxID=2174846 RepID=UPI00342DB087